MPQRLPILRLPILLALLAWMAPAWCALPDAGDLDAVLVRNVRNGFVDYDGIAPDPAFRRFVTGIGTAEASDLPDDRARLSFFINAYNSLAIRGVLDGYAPDSRFGRRAFFKRREYRVLGEDMTLHELESRELVPLGEPRIHFALVCASISCPRLPSRAYTPAALDEQLDRAARAFVNDGTRNRFDVNRKVAFLSKIYDAHRKDFEKEAGSLQKYLARYATDPDTVALLSRDGFDIRFVDADWDLNGIHRNGE